MSWQTEPELVEVLELRNDSLRGTNVGILRGKGRVVSWHQLLTPEPIGLRAALLARVPGTPRPRALVAFDRWSRIVSWDNPANPKIAPPPPPPSSNKRHYTKVEGERTQSLMDWLAPIVERMKTAESQVEVAREELTDARENRNSMIRAACADGWKAFELADATGLSRTAIHKILHPDDKKKG